MATPSSSRNVFARIKTRTKQLRASWVLRSTSKPPEVNELDHRIGLAGGSTIALEATAHRMQASKVKPPADLRIRIEELTRENGYLRLEIQYYRGCFTFNQGFHETVNTICQQQQLAYYLDAVQNEDAIEYFNELTTELQRALHLVADEQLKADESWLASWGIGNRTEGTEKGI
jgi:hypothetical protein